MAATLLAIATGTTILVAQNIGAKKISAAKKYSEASFAYNSLFSLILFLLWFGMPKAIFYLMGVKSPILEYSTRYVRFLSISLIFFGMETTAVSVMMGVGITRPIMYAGFIRNILNIVLDWLLIFGNLGFPAMNIEGAALATTISNMIAGPLLIGFVLFSKKIPFKISIKEVLKAKWSIYKEVVRIGIPTGLETLLWHIGNLILIRFLNVLDTMAAGIYTLVFGIELVAYWVYLGIAKAAMTLVGHKTGEKDHKGAINIGLTCIKYSMVVCVAFSLFFILFPKFILGIFTHDASLISRALPFLFIISITLYPRSVNVVIGHAIRGLGDTKWMLYSQIFGTFFVLIFSYTLIFVFELNMIGIFIAILSDELIRSIINFLRFYKGRKIFLVKRKISREFIRNKRLRGLE